MRGERRPSATASARDDDDDDDDAADDGAAEEEVEEFQGRRSRMGCAARVPLGDARPENALTFSGFFCSTFFFQRSLWKTLCLVFGWMYGLDVQFLRMYLLSFSHDPVFIRPTLTAWLVCHTKQNMTISGNLLSPPTYFLINKGGGVDCPLTDPWRSQQNPDAN